MKGKVQKGPKNRSLCPCGDGWATLLVHGCSSQVESFLNPVAYGLLMEVQSYKQAWLVKSTAIDD